MDQPGLALSDSHRMPLFEINKDTKRAAPIAATTFPALKLWERQDLEAWVSSAPSWRAATSPW